MMESVKHLISAAGLPVLRKALTLGRKIQGVWYLLMRNTLPIDSHKAFFINFQNDYTCNPKYIHQALTRRFPDMEVYWAVSKEEKNAHFPAGVIPVRIGTKDYYKALYTSGIWIDNALNIQKLPVKRKPGQYYLQTMHGSLGIKRIGTNASATAKQRRREEKSVALTNVAISNSAFETEVYRTSFWRDAQCIAPEDVSKVKENPEKCYIMELGHARSDVLIQAREDAALRRELREKVCRYFGVAPEKKLLLWGPTFEASTENLCQPDLALFCEALAERFGGEWMVISRLHPRDAKKQAEAGVNTGLQLDGSGYPDIQELMVAADFAVTNYSSWIFDYLLTEKPGMLFVPDLEKYSDSTGFYYPITSTPFPVVKDNNSAAAAIRQFDPEQYRARIPAFIQDKGCVEDGHAAERIVDLMAELAGI